MNTGDTDHADIHRKARGAKTPALAAAGVTLLMLAGCRVGGERSVEAENDRLRAENRELREQVTTLELREKELQALSAELASRTPQSPTEAGVAPSEVGGPLHDEIVAATPRIARIELGATPAIVWREDRAERVSIAVRTQDGRGRFTQAVGTLRVEAYALPEGSSGNATDAEAAQASGARRVASIELPPVALRDAYRSSLAGTHYAAELSPDAPLAPGTTLAVVAVLDDRTTGQRHRAEQLVTVPSPPPGR